MRRLALAVLGAVVGFGLMGGAVWVRDQWLPPTFHGAVLAPTAPAADFTLLTAGAREVHLSDFRGKVVLIAFGYRFCPDVCPVTLTELKNTLQVLGPQADQVQAIMVTVDPERDTPDLFDEHVHRYDPRLLGLGGSPEAIAAAAVPFGIFFERATGSAATQYLINHTATITAVDPEGRVRVVYPHGAAGREIAADVQYMLAGRYP